MKLLNDYKMRLVLAGFIAIIVLGGRSAKADFTFGVPTNMGPVVNTSDQCGHPSISRDGLSLYFTSLRPGGSGGYGDFWVTTRETIFDPWGPPVCLGPAVNSPYTDLSPEISADGLSLLFCSGRPGGYGGRDLWVTTRETTSDPWGPPVNLGPMFNSVNSEQSPSISTDGLSLYFRSHPTGGGDLYVATRDSVLDDWGTPVNLGPTVNHPSAYDHASDISVDGLCLFFSSDRAGGYGGRDLWVTTRATENDPWREPFNLGPTVNSSAFESTPDISADGSTLYFCSNRPGGFGSLDLWEVEILPVVDINSDGIVDSADICIMVDHWGTDESLCDIGPMPWGDGIVDVEDLKVLAEYLFGDMRCVVHFKLDEAKGNIANDSTMNRDGTVHGDPEWQPKGGAMGGALQLDGFDDYIRTGFVLNPAEGALSVFAWIKGGTPSQVVLSQTSAANWLCTDSVEGCLMTELKGMGGGRHSTGPLMSQTVITDGEWHHIGLVWDGFNRTLYVDSVAVAEDTQVGLESSDSGLYLGCGKAMESGTFFSGLIDDVRIYRRALNAEEIEVLAQ